MRRTRCKRLLYLFYGSRNFRIWGWCKFSSGSFFYLINLKSLMFDSKSEFKTGCFPHLINLEELYFGDTAKIGTTCFSPSQGYKDIETKDYNNNLETIVLPKGSSITGQASFCNYTNLKNIIFEGDIELESANFQSCINVEHIEFKGSSKIHEGSFDWALNLKELIFVGPTEVYSSTFSLRRDKTPKDQKNNALKTLTIPNGSNLRTDHGFFGYFSALEEVTFEGDIELNGGAFGHCENLKKLTLRKKSIHNAGAFAYCNNIEEINFGDATELHNGAFYACSPEQISTDSIL